MPELHDLTALAAADAVRSRKVGPVELVSHALERIDRMDARIGAFITVTPDAALAEARKAERLVYSTDDPSELPPLLGVPTAIKDLNQTVGVRTTFGSAIFRDFVPPFDDHVVELLRAAGTISLGKTNTPEFGLPCYTETDVAPPARTPWDLARTAGGSSGGAATAVAAGLIPIAQGSDGGGSIRIPASCCGLVGLKTSRGRVSRGPMDMDTSELAVLGPLARTVRDAAAFLDAVAIPQPGDRNPLPPLPRGQTFLGWCDQPPGSLRIGRFITSPVSAAEPEREVRDAWEQASRLLEELGHQIVDVEPPLPPESLPLFERVWAVGAAAGPVAEKRMSELRPLTRYLRRRGAVVSGPEYATALGTLRLLSRQWIVEHQHVDALLTPSLAMVPPKLGWFTADGDPAADFERQKAFTPYTSLFNVMGLPAISLPLFWRDDGLPIGIQLAGRPAGDGPLLALAAQLEAAVPWHTRRPAVWND